MTEAGDREDLGTSIFPKCGQGQASQISLERKKSFPQSQPRNRGRFSRQGPSSARFTGRLGRIPQSTGKPVAAPAASRPVRSRAGNDPSTSLIDPVTRLRTSHDNNPSRHVYFSQAVSIVGDLGDGLVDVGGLSGSETAPTVRPGTGGNDSRGQAAIFFFALPTVPSPNSIVAADLDLTYLGIDGAVPEFNVDLFGIGTRASATIAPSDYYDGDSALSMDALIKDNYITAATANGGLTLDAPSTANLLAFIQSLYNANGTPTAAFAVFRANPDTDLPPNSPPLRGFLLATADNVDNNGTMVPRLELTVVPEPPAAALTAIAMAFLLRFPRRGR